MTGFKSSLKGGISSNDYYWSVQTGSGQEVGQMSAARITISRRPELPRFHYGLGRTLP